MYKKRDKEPVIFEDEIELEENYPLYYGYLYIVNGEVFKNLVNAKTPKELKEILVEGLPDNYRNKEIIIRRCNIVKRNLFNYMEAY